MENMCESDCEDREIDSLFETIYQRYGYDFRGYDRSYTKRRVLYRQAESAIPTLGEMQNRVLNDPLFFQTLLLDLTINVTAMFRNPSFYRSVRETILRSLGQAEHIKVWCAGCATGEEAYSIAILLTEAGLYERARIYATDIDEVVLRNAAAGIYPIDRMQEYTRNYQAAGGQHSLSDYIVADDTSVIMSDSLKSNIVFSNHDLATDSAFAEMDVIVCRNVLIYFGKALKNRVFNLFGESLRTGGHLCLGSKESARFIEVAHEFIEVSHPDRIYKKAALKEATIRSGEGS